MTVILNKKEILKKSNPDNFDCKMIYFFPFSVADVDISVSQTPSYPPSQHGEVELFCNVYSAERTFPFVYWIRNNKIIRKGRQLKMSGLSERDEGNYTCSAKDDRGIVSNVTHFLRIMCMYMYLHLVYKSFCMHYQVLALPESKTEYEIICTRTSKNLLYSSQYLFKVKCIYSGLVFQVNYIHV